MKIAIILNIILVLTVLASNSARAEYPTPPDVEAGCDYSQLNSKYSYDQSALCILNNKSIQLQTEMEVEYGSKAAMVSAYFQSNASGTSKFNKRIKTLRGDLENFFATSNLRNAALNFGIFMDRRQLKDVPIVYSQLLIQLVFEATIDNVSKFANVSTPLAFTFNRKAWIEKLNGCTSIVPTECAQNTPVAWEKAVASINTLALILPDIGLANQLSRSPWAFDRFFDVRWINLAWVTLSFNSTDFGREMVALQNVIGQYDPYQVYENLRLKSVFYQSLRARFAGE